MHFNPLEAFISKLARLSHLQREDVDAIRALPVREVAVRPHSTIAHAGQVSTECCILVDGFAARFKVASNADLQICSCHMDGDLLDGQRSVFDHIDHGIRTVTRATVAYVPVAALRALLGRCPAIATALWRDNIVDASVYQEWITNVGRRTAKERVAHLLCEFAIRREAAGLGTPTEYPFPFIQQDIGDATGLTPVHVNRMIRTLREDGALRGQAKSTGIADWDRLRAIAGFRPEYLHVAPTDQWPAMSAVC